MAIKLAKTHAEGRDLEYVLPEPGHSTVEIARRPSLKYACTAFLSPS